MKGFINSFFLQAFFYVIATFLPFSAVIQTGENTLFFLSLFSFGLTHSLLVKYLTSNSRWQIFQTILAVISIVLFPGVAERFLSSLIFLSGVLVGKVILKPKFILIFLIFTFLSGSFLSTRDIFKLVGHEPINENYNHDSFIFLKTVYLMKEGKSYYQAFSQAVVGDVRIDEPPAEVSGYRLPALFLLWRFLPNPGLSAWIIFLFLSMILIYASFKIAQKFSSDSLAMLTPHLLLPYLLFSSRSHWFLATEWWALFPLVFFVFFFLGRRAELAYFSLLLAILIRELVLLPVLGGSLLAIFFKKKQSIIIFLSIILIFVLYYLLHIYLISQTGINLRKSSIGYLFGGSIEFVRITLAFATQYFLSVWWGLQNMALYFLITIFGGLLFLFERNKPMFEVLISYLMWLVFPAGFLIFSRSQFNEYWGIMFVPLMISLLPWSLSQILKSLSAIFKG